MKTPIAIGIATLLAGCLALAPVDAQDMLRHLDLNSAQMTTAEMSRADVEALIAAAKPGEPVDLAGRRLNGLDLSGLDLTGANFRAALLNRVNLARARLDGSVFDQAWMLKADLSGASLKKASVAACV